MKRKMVEGCNEELIKPVPYRGCGMENRGEWIWGYPRRPREDPRCPVCGRWCQTVYVRWGEALGCERCVRAVDAWEFDN